MSNAFYQPPAQGGTPGGLAGHPQPTSLADVLERVLDRGIVIAGDIKVNLLDIELLTIRLRLLIASVERAREMGINWWESDPSLSMPPGLGHEKNGDGALAQRLERIESQLGLSDGNGQEEVTAERPQELPRASRAKGQ